MCRQGVEKALFRVVGGGRFFFSQGSLHLRHAGFQRLEVGARALQYVGLHVEFLARHEVEPGKHAGKQGADVFSMSAAGLAAMTALKCLLSSSKNLESIMAALSVGSGTKRVGKAAAKSLAHAFFRPATCWLLADRYRRPHG